MSREVLASVLVLVVVLGIHIRLMKLALDDLSRPERFVRSYDKTVWAFVIAFVGIAGPLAYLYYGRDDVR